MPDFPRAHSERALTTERPMALQETADVRNEAAGNAKTLTDTAKGISDSLTKFKGVVESIQKNTALHELKVGLQEINNQAVLDQNINNAPMYKKMAEDLQKAVGKQLSPSVRNQITPEMDYMTRMGNVGLDFEFRKKIIGAGITLISKQITEEINNPNDNSEKNLKAITDQGVKDNLLSPEAAHKAYTEGVDDVRYNRFLQMYRTNPEEAERMFYAKEFGMSIQAREKGFSKLKELKRLYREAEGERFSEMMERIPYNELPDDEIRAALAANQANPNEGITRDHARRLMASKYRDIEKRIKVKEYEKIRKAIDFIYNDRADRIQMYEGVLEAYEAGMEGDNLKMVQDLIKLRKDKAWMAKDNVAHNILEGANALFGWTTNESNKKRAEMWLDYARKVVKGQDNMEAVRDVMFDEEVKEHNALGLNPDLGATFSPTKGLRTVTPSVKQDKK